ncbi:hypothetical protein VYU27_009658 [Nannochloropsis oceanica]
MSPRLVVAVGAACSLASLTSAFLLPSAPSCAGRPSIIRDSRKSSSVAAAKKEKTAWDGDQQYEVLPTDSFVLRPEIKDYAKLTDEEMAATEGAGRTEPDKAHTTFVPPSHPFAHARLLNVVCRVGNLEKTVSFYEALGFINLRERVTTEYSAAVMGFG